jgi:hypothetical protein
MPSDDLANPFTATLDSIFSNPRHNAAEMNVIQNVEAAKRRNMLIE